MNIITQKEISREMELVNKIEILSLLESKVKELIESHISKRKLWFSSDFLPADEKMSDDHENITKSLRERAKGIKEAARVALAINLLTEEGLPQFHRIIAKHLGDDNFWSKWNNMWTAEEDRHGCILRDYVREARVFNFRIIEMMQFNYQQAGFNPNWNLDPYKTFVYTTLQEKATQISHKNTGKYAGEEEPLIGKILNSIAADEAKHYIFYRNIFKEILELDPNRAILSAAEIIPGIEMPGLAISNFREMADVVRRVGIYGPRDYKNIVEEVIKYWNIEVLAGLNDIAKKAQEKILSIPARLEKVAEYIELRNSKKTFSFDFIYNRILLFE